MKKSLTLVANGSVKPQQRGLRRGNPGNKGSGGTSNAYRLWLASLLESPAHQREFVQVIQDKDHPAFIPATKHAAAYAHGMPTQAIEVKDVTPEQQMTGEQLRGRLMSLLPSVLQTLPANAQERALLLSGLQQAETVMEDSDE